MSCNRVSNLDFRFELDLSVSTIGTNELQQQGVNKMESLTDNFQFPQSERMSCNTSVYDLLCRDTRAFQFPQSERMSCNSRASSKPAEPCELSVSTIGTNELQQLLKPHVITKQGTFSFHNRNE